MLFPNSSCGKRTYWGWEVTSEQAKITNLLFLHCFLIHINFQRIFEVRFAEHLVNVIEAVLHNRDGCIEVWKQISAEGTRHEKAEASGFLRKWTTGSNQIWLTALMGDVAKVFKNLQKNFQSDDLILTDVITCRDTAIRKLDLMSNAPYPGGCEKIS